MIEANLYNNRYIPVKKTKIVALVVFIRILQVDLSQFFSKDTVKRPKSTHFPQQSLYSRSSQNFWHQFDIVNGVFTYSND